MGVTLTLLGIGCYAFGFYAVGLEGLLNGTSVNLYAWICAAVASFHVFMEFDMDEFWQKALLCLLDVVVVIDCLLRIVPWLWQYVYVNGALDPVHCGIAAFPVAAGLVNALVGRIIPAKPDGSENSNELTTRDKCLLASCGVLIATLYAMLLLDPKYNPWASKDLDFAVAVFGEMIGMKVENPPTIWNIPEWSIRMKLLGGFTVVSFLGGVFSGTRKKIRYIFRQLVSSTFYHIIVVYLTVLFFVFRKNVLIAEHEFVFTFVDMLIAVIAGIYGFFGPPLLLFPNASKALFDTVYGNNSSGKDEALEEILNDMQEREEKMRDRSVMLPPYLRCSETGLDVWERVRGNPNCLTYRNQRTGELAHFSDPDNISRYGAYATSDEGKDFNTN